MIYGIYYIMIYSIYSIYYTILRYNSESYLLLTGLQAEHQHILTVSADHMKSFDKLELFQTLLESHMKDIHTALKGLMGKTKAIAERVQTLEQAIGSQRIEMQESIQHVSNTILLYILFILYTILYTLYTI